MSVNVYMIFNGNCREAAEYYAEVFKTGKPEIMLFGDMPPDPSWEMPEEVKDKVMHTSLNIHGSEVMFSDTMPNAPVVFGKNINVTVVSDNLEQMTEEFNRLGQDGKVQMEMQKTFWSPAYGAVEDKFGIDWQFSFDDGTNFQN
ncbi:PhnB protein [Planomicrobium koreense]|uniref:PhnB protein n=1 Tax=Planococcus koreensis TaxID=112331 RepID=A0A7W8CQR6_9BACL|nr:MULTISPECIES: VOC family protein [Planococcus]MBB5179833.1 PhnB protein [Planococcus koreensis]MDN3450452.1 VOC family protein [Planococcus sp. APC 3906]